MPREREPRVPMRLTTNPHSTRIDDRQKTANSKPAQGLAERSASSTRARLRFGAYTDELAGVSETDR